MPRFARFVLAGTLNTAASYLVYLLLLPVADYRVAYTVAYVAGLAGGYWANARFVFAAAPRMATLTGYLLCYGATYAVSLAVLWGVVAWAGTSRPLAMLAALTVAVPLSYALLRFNFSQGPASSAKQHGTGID
jgi:putative flippase GtrA